MILEKLEITRKLPQRTKGEYIQGYVLPPEILFKDIYVGRQYKTQEFWPRDHSVPEGIGHKLPPAGLSRGRRLEWAVKTSFSPGSQGVRRGESSECECSNNWEYKVQIYIYYDDLHVGVSGVALIGRGTALAARQRNAPAKRGVGRGEERRGYDAKRRWSR